jgi:SAM-dependent methyltransferase
MTSSTPTATSQYQHSAEWYDSIYAAQGKDYAAEAAVVAQLVRERVPSAGSLLDVACGTGRHLVELATRFGEAVGVDLDAQFVEAARLRGLDAHVGDMRSFDLGRRFDAVVSLYSGIGHVGSTEGLDEAISTMARHLEPGGVLVLEPWVGPDMWRAGEYGVEIVDGPDSILTRTNHTDRDGDTSIIRFSWTRVDAGGIVQLQEELRLSLFTDAQYAAAFERAGLEATFDERGCNDDGRGLWIGVAPRSR